QGGELRRRDFGGAEERFAGRAGGLHEVLQRLRPRGAGQRGQQQAAGGGAGEHGSLAEEGAAVQGKALLKGGRRRLRRGRSGSPAGSRFSVNRRLPGKVNFSRSGLPATI